MASVKYDDLETAFHFINSGGGMDASAHVSRETGQIIWRSDDLDLENPPPPEIDDPYLFASVPSQQDLGLGKALALEYASETIPDDYDQFASIFRNAGAFARFKDLLKQRDLIQSWYDFEQAARKRALTDWAQEEGFSVHE